MVLEFTRGTHHNTSMVRHYTTNMPRHYSFTRGVGRAPGPRQHMPRPLSSERTKWALTRGHRATEPLLPLVQPGTELAVCSGSAHGGLAAHRAAHRTLLPEQRGRKGATPSKRAVPCESALTLRHASLVGTYVALLFQVRAPLFPRAVTLCLLPASPSCPPPAISPL